MPSASRAFTCSECGHCVVVGHPSARKLSEDYVDRSLARTGWSRAGGVVVCPECAPPRVTYQQTADV